MRALRATDLLDVWDLGRGRHPVDRALVVLAFTYPDRPWDQLCALPVGERNRRLLAARAACFGQRLDIVSACPACGAQLEFEFSFPLEDFPPVEAGEVETVSGGGAALRLRLPDSHDLAALAGEPDPALARRLLLSRCVLTSKESDLEELAATFSAAIESHDPLADIAFPVTCAECGCAWRATLDPIDYLWRELGQRVAVLVREVHALARAYGWTEAEVLRLSPARRKLYLEQVGA